MSSQNTNKQQLDRYRLLVDSVQDYAIFLLDPDGRIATWNPGAKRFKGYESEEIIGKHFSVFYPDEDKDKPAREIEEALAYGRVEDEGWRVRKDGTTFWASVVITALRRPDGGLEGFAKVTRDLTERKKMEDELVAANTLLLKQQAELKELNEVKDEFISLASHQLRTPATGVKQYLGILLEGILGELSEEHLEILRKAYASNERQIHLVNDLLQVAQIDAGKITLQKESVDIGSLTEDAINEQVDSIREKKQMISFSNDSEILVEIDPKRFRMALENIIDNASKYSPTGGSIFVSIESRPNEVIIHVKDSGIGISKEDRQRLFTKFSRIKNSHTDDTPGSGLGLYWAKKIMDLHNGDLNVSSEEGKGSTFSFTLPRRN